MLASGYLADAEAALRRGELADYYAGPAQRFCLDRLRRQTSLGRSSVAFEHSHPSSMPKPVFISYARKASRDYAAALHAALGEDIAFLDSEDIPFGDAFPERLVDALLDSCVVVILAEPVYFTRWYCLLEYRLARTPFLRLGERPGVKQRERDEELRGIVVAMPPGDKDPMLERFPAFVQGRNWAPVSDAAAIAQLVRHRLDANPPTLRERYER